jgi:hypothetical protein
MRKIPSLFQRNYDTDRLVRNEVVPGCEWVLANEGVATEKMDGTCCMIQNGVMFKRYELKGGHRAPSDFIPAQDADPITGDIPGWVRVTDGPEDKWHREAFENCNTYSHHVEQLDRCPDGTYELLGPKIQGDPYNFPAHTLYKHGDMVLEGVPHDFDGIRDYLDNPTFVGHAFGMSAQVVMPYMEGIVWYHPDGRMAKIKRRDFGLKWPVEKTYATL